MTFVSACAPAARASSGRGLCAPANVTVGLDTRSHTGWQEDGLYAPHTQAGDRAPPNKTLLLLLNGLLAKRGVRQARRAGKLS